MAMLSAHSNISAPEVAEDVVLSLCHHVGDFAVTVGGENASGAHSGGWLSIARYAPQDGSPGEGSIIPSTVEHGAAEFGVLTTSQLRDLALAMTRAADRYDA